MFRLASHDLKHRKPLKAAAEPTKHASLLYSMHTDKFPRCLEASVFANISRPYVYSGSSIMYLRGLVPKESSEEINDPAQEYTSALLFPVIPDRHDLQST